MQKENIQGQRFGQIVAVKNATRQYGKGTVWEFLCDCGNVTYSTVGNVKAGRKKSCGCRIYKERIPRETPLLPHRYWHKFLVLANRRKIPVEITAPDLEFQWKKQKGICPFTGRTLTLPATAADVRYPTYNASVDRIDSSKGYTKDNIQWVLTQVNFMKQNLSDEDFISLCREITEYRGNDAF